MYVSSQKNIWHFLSWKEIFITVPNYSIDMPQLHKWQLTFNLQGGLFGVNANDSNKKERVVVKIVLKQEVMPNNQK